MNFKYLLNVTKLCQSQTDMNICCFCCVVTEMVQFNHWSEALLVIC